MNILGGQNTESVKDLGQYRECKELLDASEPKWVNSISDIIGVNSPRLEGFQLWHYRIGGIQALVDLLHKVLKDIEA